MNDGVCLQELVVKIETQYVGNEGISGGAAGITGKCSATSGVTDDDGNVAICECRQPGENTLTPFKNDNPLNGVSTYDLVLISRHILGQEPLGNPYKMVAADANKSGSITSFDLVELRKLILGVYQTLPNNSSWRFIFPNPNNPFQSVFPEQYVYTMPSVQGVVNFYGVKVGDVNGNAIAHLTGTGTVNREAPIMPLGMVFPSARQGEIIEIPIFVQQNSELVAWQMALRYDAAQIRIKNVRWTTLNESTPYEMADWQSPAPGELRLCWFDRRGTAIHLPAQSPIAYVQVEWLGNGSRSPKPFLELTSTIPGEAYGSDGQVSAFVLQEVAQYQAPIIPVKMINKKQEWTVLAYPNPTNGLFRFEVSMPVGGAGLIGLYDPLGRQVAQQDYSFTPGLNVVTSRQFPPLGTGIYFVRFDTPLGRQTLRLVKN